MAEIPPATGSHQDQILVDMDHLAVAAAPVLQVRLVIQSLVAQVMSLHCMTS
jgi:hypothetical protein